MTESSDQVGYCRPPAHSRFQKCQSGHPGGKSRLPPEGWEAGREPTMNFAEEDCRELPGERYDGFETRFDRVVAAGSVDGLLALAEDFQSAPEIPASGNS